MNEVEETKEEKVEKASEPSSLAVSVSSAILIDAGEDRVYTLHGGSPESHAGDIASIAKSAGTDSVILSGEASLGLVIALRAAGLRVTEKE